MSGQMVFPGLLLAMLAAATVGCGDAAENPLGRKAVTGTVTLDGAPLDHGAISFQPDNVLGTASSVNAGAMIEGGEYRIPADQGLLPGLYRVSITSPQPAAEPTDDPVQAMNQAAQQQVAPDRIPAKYNVNSELSIEVKEDESSEFNFELSSN